MKQESSKKNKKLIWLIAGLAALLVVVGVVLAIFVLPGGSGDEGPVGGRPELYWNVDRQLYIGDETSGGLSTREPAEDGLYHIRFSVNGELVEYTFADKRLVNVIDNMDVMALVKDAEGNAIDALSPDTVATEVAKGFFVQGINGNNLNLNSSIVMNGMQNSVEICELTQIYNVDAMAEVPGQIDELEMMDKVLVYSNDMGQVTHIYILERQPEAEVYWRVGRYYDSTNKVTTREPDENGVYTLVFAKDAQHVELKCKDKALVDKIDTEGGEYNAPKGLQFDEEGYIVGLVDPAVALRGKLAGSEYHITEMNGNTITATYLLSGKENGKTFTVTVPEDCPIYNVCVGGSAEMIGEPTELQMTDRIICYTDMEGKPILIYVMYRMVDVPIYWNITQLYNSTTKLTNRVPDGNGYYVFKMATGGKQVTLRTKDQAIASTIDSFNHCTCGLEVEGDIIKRAYKSWYVTGGDRYGVGAERFAISQTGAILSFADNVARSSYDSPTNLILSADVEIYDVSGYPGTTVGEPTTINPGDTFRLLTDYNNNITHIFVVNKYTGFPIYYNFSRSYNYAKAETSRTPDADGYYVYEMASRGKTVTVKTKDKSIASVIDKQNAPIVALDVRDGIVRGAYPAVSSLEFGYKTANYHLFESITEDGLMTATIEGRENEHFTFKVAEDVKIYNCSEVYSNNRGEQVSEIEHYDQIQAVATKVTGEVKEIYIMKRQAESKFYYNIAAKYNSKTKETTREPNEDGYYVLDLVADGVLKQFRTKDKALASMADYYATKPFGMRVSGDIIKGVFSATSIKGVKAEIANNYDVMGVSNGKLSLTNYWPGSSNMGKSTEQTLASNYKAYDVSPYADPMGGKVKLAKGDHRIICYTNKAGEVEWVFVRYRNTHEKGHISYCEHCNKNVYWLPYTGDTYSTYGTDAHLYLAADCSYKQKTHGKLDMPESERTEAVLDLNGHTLQSTNGRCFLVYGDMTILDTVGGGKILGGMKDNKANGGAVMLGKGGNLTLLSGTLAENPDSLTNTAGGVLYVGDGSTFTMRGGVVEGGTASQGGGNIYIRNGATFNMTGGTVKGDILVVDPSAKINIGGTANITMGNDYGLRLPQGIILPLDGITADTKVVVDAAGVFTEKSDKIESYKANFSPSTTELPLTVKDGALAGGLLRHCEHCDKDVYFTRYVISECKGSSHMVMVEDKTVGEQITIGSSSRHTDDVVIDLNGHTITVTKTGDSGQATGRFALLYAKLSILDSSKDGKGKIVSNYSSNRAAGLILAHSGAVLNLYGGEITMADGVSVENSGGLITLAGYKNTETVKQDGAVMNIYGGVVSNGVAKNGGNISISEGSTLNVYGGEIKNGKTHLAIAKPLTTDKDGKVTSYSYTSGLGGNIYMSKNSKLNIGNASGETAAITGGKARIGGNIYVPAGAFATVEKTGVVSNGYTLDHRTNELDKAFVGGNIYSMGTVVVKGKVSDGIAWGGGNISIGGGSKLTIDGGVVENGVATGYPGGNIYGNNAVVELINNALVTDGVTETLYGGNISMGSGGEVYITNSTVSNGKAQTNGGNIYHSGRVLKEDKNDPDKITGYDNGVIALNEGAVVTGGTTALPKVTENTDGSYKYTSALGGNIYLDDYAKVVIGGESGKEAKVLDGSARVGGNIFLDSYSELIVEKTGVVANGTTVNHRGNEKDYAYNGGNIFNYGTVTVKGKVVDGTAYSGGNIGAAGSTKTFIDGGVLTGGVAEGGRGGNYYGNNSIMTATNDAVFSDGLATREGGNIYGAAGSEIYLTDSTVAGGKGTIGGNIYMASRELYQDKEDPNKLTGYDMGILVATDSVITGGVATTADEWSGGGNIYGNNSKVTVNGTKVDLGESSQCGGNILVNKGELVIGKGSVIEGGVLHDNDDNDHIASNIGKFGFGKIEIQEGAVVTGGEGCDETIYISDTSLSDAKAIFAGEITGHLYVTKGVVAEFNSAKIDGKLTVAASAVSATVNGDTQIDVLSGGIELGELTENAKIVVSTAGIFTDKNAEKAQAYKDAGYFVSAVEGMDIVVWEEALATGLVRNCAHCNNEPALWSVFNPKTTSYKGVTKHMVVTKDAQMDWQLNIAADSDVVIDLDGKTLTVPDTSSSGRFALVYGKLAILDSSAEKSGTVITNMSDFRSGGLFLSMSGSELNIYGGTFTMADDVYAGTGGIVYVNGNATFNMYGGKLSGGHVKPSGETDSDGVYKCGEGGNIYAKKESYVYIHGGIIENGVAEPLPLTTEEGGVVTITGYAKGFGGNIGVESKCSALTIYKDAVVTGGQAYDGGNIYTKQLSTILGTVSNGKATNNGGNIYHLGTINIGKADGSVEAKVIDGEAKNGGNIYSAWVLNVHKGATVSGGHAINGNGGNIYINCSHKVSDNKVTSVVAHNIYGTVSDGVAEGNGVFGGNIYKDGSSTLNIGKEDGSADALVTRGKAPKAGNIYVKDGATATVGGTVSTGGGALIVHKGATISYGETDYSYGGNIGVGSNKTMCLYGTVTEGTAKTAGGNIALEGGATLKSYGGTISNGEAETTGGNINANNGHIYLTEGTKVSNGIAGTDGGNIYQAAVSGKRTHQITDSTVEGGQAQRGGSICLIGSADNKQVELTATNSQITGGVATSTTQWSGGGNIYGEYSKITVNGGKVADGQSSQCGGNIMVKKSGIVIGTGAVVKDGVINDNDNYSHVGSNIGKLQTGDLEIQTGAVVTGGEGCETSIFVGDSTNSGAKFIIAGEVDGIVNLGSGAVGEINSGKVNGKMTVNATAQSLTVSGAAQIAELALPAGYKITVGEMADTADVKLSGVAVGSEISNELADPTKAPDYAKYFSVIDSDVPVGGINGKLVYGYVRACAHCNGADALFVPYTQPANRVFTENAHLILTATTNSGQITVGKCSSHGTANADCNHDVDVVIDLNDNEFISTNRTFLVYGNLSIQDTGTDSEKVGKVVSNYASQTTNNGQNILISNGVLNLYGGEVTMAEGSAVTTGKGGIVYVTGTFNMYGGTVKGGTAGYGGNIYGYTNSIINIQGGTVTGGRGTSGGGNFYIYAGTFNLGGENTLIENGSTGGQGGNIYVSGATTINMTGGTIQNGSTDGTDYQDNVRLNSNSVMNMTGGTIYGTNGVVAGVSSAINVNGSTLNIGGTASVIRADGSKDGLIGIAANATGFHILDGWTGTASFAYHDLTSNYAGVTLDTAKFACGELGTDGTFTAGGNYTGTLFYEYGDEDLAVTVVDEATGAMKIADAVVNP